MLLGPSSSSRGRECLSRLCPAPNGMFLLLPADNSHPVFWTTDQRGPGLHRAIRAAWMERTSTQSGVGRVGNRYNNKAYKQTGRKKSKTERMSERKRGKKKYPLW